MSEFSALNRVAFSPGEFAELFGKSQTWGYRQIYASKVNAITEHGRILIPAKEVERILEKAGIYNGKEKPKQSKAEFKKLTTEEQSVWQRFVKNRRGADAEQKPRMEVPASKHNPKSSASPRQSLLARVAKSWRDNAANR